MSHPHVALAMACVAVALQSLRVAAQDAAPPPPTVGETRSVPTAEEVARREQGALLGAGARTVEVGVAYARTEHETFPLARVESTAATATLTGRYGLKPDLQLTARLPFVATQTKTLIATSAGPSSSTTNDSYAGDLSLSLLGAAVREAVGRPNILLSLDAILPTGPGDKGLGASAILSKSFDPVVLFGSIAYMYGFAVDTTDIRRQLPRDGARVTAGYTYAVNDSLALNNVATWTNNSTTVVAAGSLPEPHNRLQLQFGLTWMLKRGLFLEPALAFRIGASSPDATLSLNVPYTF